MNITHKKTLLENIFNLASIMVEFFFEYIILIRVFPSIFVLLPMLSLQILGCFQSHISDLKIILVDLSGFLHRIRYVFGHIMVVIWKIFFRVTT